MKTLVTGGAGFIGSHFVRMALAGEIVGYDELIVVDKLTYAANKKFAESLAKTPFVTFYQADINDKLLMSKIMQNVDLVINFAAESHVDNSIKSASEFVHSNVLGTQSLLDVALDSNIYKYIQISTDEVYGSIGVGSWEESSPLLPNSPYSASKAGGDLLCRAYYKTHDLPISITRSSNNYGPNQNLEKFIPTIINSLRIGKKVPVYGDGNNVRDWIFVKDHCYGIDLVAKNGLVGEIYNIGGGIEITNIQLVCEIQKIMEITGNTIEFVPDRKGHDIRYSLNWNKIKSIGYSPKCDFQDSLRKTIYHTQNSEC